MIVPQNKLHSLKNRLHCNGLFGCACTSLPENTCAEVVSMRRPSLPATNFRFLCSSVGSQDICHPTKLTAMTSVANDAANRSACVPVCHASSVVAGAGVGAGAPPGEGVGASVGAGVGASVALPPPAPAGAGTVVSAIGIGAGTV